MAQPAVSTLADFLASCGAQDCLAGFTGQGFDSVQVLGRAPCPAACAVIGGCRSYWDWCTIRSGNRRSAAWRG